MEVFTPRARPLSKLSQRKDPNRPVEQQQWELLKNKIKNKNLVLSDLGTAAGFGADAPTPFLEKAAYQITKKIKNEDIIYVFTDIHTYRVYIQNLTGLYTWICTYPDSACTHQKKTFHHFGGEISVTDVLMSLQVTDVGQINFQLLFMCVWLQASFPSYSAEVLQTNMGYFTGYYGSRVGSYIVSPSHNSTTGTLQGRGCRLNDQCCSLTVYVQNFWTRGKNV